MIKDELDTVERYIRELEALRNYPQVKSEKDSLAAEITQLKEKVAQLTSQLMGATYMQKNTLSQLKKRESEVKDLNSKLNEAQRELSSLKDFKARLPGSSGLTLEKIRDQFLSAQAKEIEAKVSQRVKELTKEMHSRMPALIQEEFTKVLSSPNWSPEIKKAVSVEARRIADETLRDGAAWPEWFKDYFFQRVKEAVSQELNTEFEKRVTVEAMKRLEAMKAHQWEQYSDDKASRLSINLKAMVTQLQGTWHFTCDRCRRHIALEIGSSEIGQLLGGATVYVTCSSCVDPAAPPFIFSTAPHRVVVTFADLLRGYLGESPPAG